MFSGASDVNWMDSIFLSNSKVSECKLGPFEHTQSISNWPIGLVCIGNFINYLLYLPVPFPRGLCIDLGGSSIFLPLTLLIFSDRLGLFSQLYKTLLNYLSAYLVDGLALQPFTCKLGGTAP